MCVRCTGLGFVVWGGAGGGGLQRLEPHGRPVHLSASLGGCVTVDFGGQTKEEAAMVRTAPVAELGGARYREPLGDAWQVAGRGPQLEWSGVEAGVGLGHSQPHTGRGASECRGLCGALWVGGEL